ncbi:MAG: ABC transporter ATP-binding protein [Inquilinaceae bacterium]
MAAAIGQPASDVVLEVRNLKTYIPLRTGMLKAVDDVSFSLRRGLTTCIVGESGSGKSVTARSILQILDPPSKIVGGQMLLHRHRTARGADRDDQIIDIAGLGARSKEIRGIRGRDIAMIFQEPMSSLSPVHTIGAQIMEAVLLHERMPRDKARERTIEMLRRVEIPKPETAVDRYPFEYSGGMRQRAMIAMALSCNPSILIADEPTTALDVTTQAEILDLIKQLQTEFGMAVMFITHDMGVVAEIAEDVVVMHRGKVMESGSVDRIFHRPEDAYTRMLLASVTKLETRSTLKTAAAAANAIPPILRLRDLEMHFPVKKGFLQRVADHNRAVDGVSFDLRRGEALGIVGESGSGKTTLGRCIANIHHATGGSIEYVDRHGTAAELVGLNRAAARPFYRDIRMVFQDPYASLNPRMTIGQIVGEPLLVNGVAKGADLRDRVAYLLERVGLQPDFMERYPHAFSGGQRQRVSIARAIALEPRIIIADEATSALDVSIRAQVLDLLLELQNALDLSFLFIAHDIGVIRYFCDRVGVMYQGKLVEIGDADQVCDSPTHAYTQALLSAVPRPDPRHRGIARRVRYRGEAG